MPVQLLCAQDYFEDNFEVNPAVLVVRPRYFFIGHLQIEKAEGVEQSEEEFYQKDGCAKDHKDG